MDSGPTSSSSPLSWDTVIVLVGNWNNPDVECSESLRTEAPYLLQGLVGPDWIRRRGQLRYQTAPVAQGGIKGYRIEDDATDRAGLRQRLKTFYESQGPS